jgi:succinyl-diaminopimelate desuccinylase
MTTILEYLQTLIEFYPATNQQAHVRELLEYCAHELDQSGSFKDVKIHEINGVHSLTASTQGTQKPKVLLQAHVDVVPADESSRSVKQLSPAEIGGRGVYDMLFGAACYLYFVQQHRDELSKLDFGLMLTGDEEAGGFDSAESLIKLGYCGDVCILPDAGNGFGDLSVAAKGIYNFDFMVNGKAHHGSRPWEGDNAADKLVRALTDLGVVFDASSRQNSTLTISRLEAGDADNKGPGLAKARLDIRYKDQADLKRIKDELEKLYKKYDAEALNLTYGSDYQLDIDVPLVRSFVELYAEHVGKAVTFSQAYGSSDARFFAEAGVPVIMLRPEGSGAHADDERVNVNEIEKCYKLIEDYLMRVAKT